MAGDAEQRLAERHARGAHVVRAHLLDSIATALHGASLRALLVKGAGLAATSSVYERPWERAMSDIDLLVEPARCRAVLDALAGSGFAIDPTMHSRTLLGESKATRVLGGLAWLVEVHTHLDKMVPRPVPFRGLWQRAAPYPDASSLRVPCPEDHALLVIAHLAAADFHHPVGWEDLARLMHGDFDWQAFEARARRWRLATAVYVALETLPAAAGGNPAAAEVAARLRPRSVRRWVLHRSYRPGSLPVCTRPASLGWRWVQRQTALRDDTLRWLFGVARYGLHRVPERLR